MNSLVIYDSESIRGKANIIINSLMRHEKDEFTDELIEKLKAYHDEYVICYFHPMGSWTIKKGQDHHKPIPF